MLCQLRAQRNRAIGATRLVRACGLGAIGALHPTRCVALQRRVREAERPACTLGGSRPLVITRFAMCPDEQRSPGPYFLQRVGLRKTCANYIVFHGRTRNPSTAPFFHSARVGACCACPPLSPQSPTADASPHPRTSPLFSATSPRRGRPPRRSGRRRRSRSCGGRWHAGARWGGAPLLGVGVGSGLGLGLG